MFSWNRERLIESTSGSRNGQRLSEASRRGRRWWTVVFMLGVLSGLLGIGCLAAGGISLAGHQVRFYEVDEDGDRTRWNSHSDVWNSVVLITISIFVALTYRRIYKAKFDVKDMKCHMVVLLVALVFGFFSSGTAIGLIARIRDLLESMEGYGEKFPGVCRNIDGDCVCKSKGEVTNVSCENAFSRVYDLQVLMMSLFGVAQLLLTIAIGLSFMLSFCRRCYASSGDGYTEVITYTRSAESSITQPQTTTRPGQHGYGTAHIYPPPYTASQPPIGWSAARVSGHIPTAPPLEDVPMNTYPAGDSAEPTSLLYPPDTRSLPYPAK